MAMTVREIVEQVLRDVENRQDHADETPVNINNGTLTGGQHVTNTVINGDYIPGNKNGKRHKR